MRELYEPDRHEEYREAAWDAETTLARLQMLISNMQSFLDKPEKGDSDRALSIYAGDAGVVFALLILKEAGYEVGSANYRLCLNTILTNFRKNRQNYWLNHSPYFGEMGISYVAHRLDRSNGEAWSTMKHLAESACLQPQNDIAWGAPGVLHMLNIMANPFPSVSRRLFDHILGSWHFDTNMGVPIWNQDWKQWRGNAKDVYQFFGYFHGAPGNICSLLGYLSVNPDEAMLQDILAKVEAFLSYFDRSDDGYNILHYRGGSKKLLQYCHGSPGMLCGLSRYPAIKRSGALMNLLEKAADLVIAAGPLKKQDCLCHGTSGLGAALYRLFLLTGNSHYLQAAKRFAAHLCAGPVAEDVGYFTGQAGTAVFLASILSETDLMELV